MLKKGQKRVPTLMKGPPTAGMVPELGLMRKGKGTGKGKGREKEVQMDLMPGWMEQQMD
jgi:hypothetical protein